MKDWSEETGDACTGTSSDACTGTSSDACTGTFERWTSSDACTHFSAENSQRNMTGLLSKLDLTKAEYTALSRLCASDDDVAMPVPHEALIKTTSKLDISVKTVTMTRGHIMKMLAKRFFTSGDDWCLSNVLNFPEDKTTETTSVDGVELAKNYVSFLLDSRDSDQKITIKKVKLGKDEANFHTELAKTEKVTRKDGGVEILFCTGCEPITSEKSQISTRCQWRPELLSAWLAFPDKRLANEAIAVIGAGKPFTEKPTTGRLHIEQKPYDDSRHTAMFIDALPIDKTTGVEGLRGTGQVIAGLLASTHEKSFPKLNLDNLKLHERTLKIITADWGSESPSSSKDAQTQAEFQIDAEKYLAAFLPNDASFPTCQWNYYGKYKVSFDSKPPETKPKLSQRTLTAATPGGAAV